ncbi:hypothetical protein ACOMHN_006888 [Nucella lapillus]
MTQVAMTGTANLDDFEALPPVVAGRRTYNEEYVRLASYSNMAPLEGCHPVLMARAGLYYTGPVDAVQCFSCATVLSNWRLQELDPVKLHRQTAPNCGHSRGEDSSNAAITAPDAAATARIKDVLRQRCAALDENPTQVYIDVSRSFCQAGGVTRGEMMGGGGGSSDLEASGPSALAPAGAAASASLGSIGGGGSLVEVNVTENVGERSRPSPGIDFELCKASTTERLRTFEHWPPAAQVHPLDLAEAGFVYTGPQDRVQCVHCEGSLRNWQSGDVPSEEHARHFPTCPTIRSGQVNVAPPAASSSSSSSSSSVAATVGGAAASASASALASASAAIVTSNTSFGERISRNTPPPPVLQGGATSETPPVPRRELLGIVTDRPKHPSMAIEAARIGSFSSWPTGKSQTPQQLAKAGFFYAGFNNNVSYFSCVQGSTTMSVISPPVCRVQRQHQLFLFLCAGFNDSVKCFFCDGGLRNWERDDDPWHEHARWFPRCKYVRQVKGDQFLEQVASQENGRVQQTATYEDRGADSPAVMVEGERRRSRSGSAGREGRQQAPVAAVEPREVMARMDMPVVRAVLNMDIPQDLVRRAIEHRLRTTGDDFPNMEALLETVFELSATHQSTIRHAGSGEPSPINTGSPVRRPLSGEPLQATEAPRSLIEENRQLKEQRTCKVCMDEEVCVVFVPCGHLVCCATCAPPLSKCPICRSTIRGTVRTYMS